MRPAPSGQTFGVWITTRAPSGKVVTVPAHDLSVAGGARLTFASEADAAEYAEQRQRWYERRHLWCEVATGVIADERGTD